MERIKEFRRTWRQPINAEQQQRKDGLESSVTDPREIQSPKSQAALPLCFGSGGGTASAEEHGATVAPQASPTAQAAGNAQAQYMLRHPLFFATQVVAVVLNALFLFGLPWLSWLFNDHLGYMGELCDTPASALSCPNGRNYTELAIQLGRFNAHGQPIGCACENGWFSDWACAIDAWPERFSVSYFIGTAPGTGAMAALSMFPIMAQSVCGAGSSMIFEHCHPETSPSSWAARILKASLLLFLIFFGLFLICTDCVVRPLHIVVVNLFIAAEIVHYITVVIVMGYGTPAGKMIAGLLTLAIVGLLAGVLYPTNSTYLGQHAFYLSECFALTCAWTIAVITLYFYKSRPP